jgi:hypothetical protein
LNSLIKDNAYYVDSVNLKPKEPLILTSELNIEQIIANTYNFDRNVDRFYRISMLQIKGVEIAGWPTNHASTFQKVLHIVELQIIQSPADFYLNKKPLSELECTVDLIPENEATVFSYFRNIEFGLDVQYEKNQRICPYIFRNANLVHLFILDQIDSKVVRTLWKFQILASNESAVSINSHIYEFKIEGYNYAVDESILSPLVLQHVIYIKLYCTIGSIQIDVFKSYKYLSIISLNLYSLGNFFHKIGIEWTLLLNRNSFVEFSKYKYGGIDWVDNNNYAYPVEDFCIFAHFPHERQIIPILDSPYLSECTTTIEWLIQNYDRYATTLTDHKMQNALSIHSVCKETVNSKQRAKYLNKQIKVCKLTATHHRDYALYLDHFQVVTMIIFAQNLIVFIFIPTACSIGLVFNLSVIITIRKNKKKELKEEFFKYMSLNSKFNCMYCLIFAFYPINYCIERRSNLFCSSVDNTLLAQYFKIIVLTYLGESVKMCSNITYIFMTLNRYMLIGKEHSPTLTRISKVKFKKVLRITAAFSFGINIGHIWQYDINNGLVYQYINMNNVHRIYDIYPILGIHSSFSSFT